MNILIIDDNLSITENIKLYLEAKWYQTSTAKDGEVAYDMIMSHAYDFLIVDRMMPNIDGLSLIRMLQARKVSIPFLFLTALSKQVDKIEWLSLWADDYLIKPFDLEELALRIENILKRNGKQISPTSSINIEDIAVDLESKLVQKRGKKIYLSPKEYALLEVLLKNRGKIMDRDSLYEEIWGEYEASTETLETINVHIAHLRRKLWSDIIRTVKLIGYVIDKD
jgi:DNA-binding response OmpR family regulator